MYKVEQTEILCPNAKVFKYFNKRFSVLCFCHSVHVPISGCSGRFPLGAHDSNYRNHAVEQHRKIMLCLPGAKRVKRRKHVNHTIEISWHIHLALLKTFITSRFKKLHCLPFSGTCRLIFTHLHWPSIPAPYFTFFAKLMRRRCPCC